MPKRTVVSKPFRNPEFACAHVGREFPRPGRAINRRVWRELGLPDSQSANPIPVCSHAIVNDWRQLWTSGALPVDGVGVTLRGFRKSHHLIRAGPGATILDWKQSGRPKRISLLRA